MKDNIASPCSFLQSLIKEDGGWDMGGRRRVFLIWLVWELRASGLVYWNQVEHDVNYSPLSATRLKWETSCWRWLKWWAAGVPGCWSWFCLYESDGKEPVKRVRNKSSSSKSQIGFPVSVCDELPRAGLIAISVLLVWELWFWGTCFGGTIMCR